MIRLQNFFATKITNLIFRGIVDLLPLPLFPFIHELRILFLFSNITFGWLIHVISDNIPSDYVNVYMFFMHVYNRMMEHRYYYAYTLNKKHVIMFHLNFRALVQSLIFY